MKSAWIIILYLVFVLGLSACFNTRKLGSAKEDKSTVELEVLCDSITHSKTQYISKIDTRLTIGEERYDAKLNLYYIQDSAVYMTAVNTGFEIARAGIFRDSLLYINRIDKEVYIYKNTGSAGDLPITLNDLEFLLNKRKLCDYHGWIADSLHVLLDLSTQGLQKRAFFRKDDLNLMKFEFYNKKSGEYIVGEGVENGLHVYSNFLGENIELITDGSKVEYDKEINIKLRYNSSKYTVYHL